MAQEAPTEVAIPRPVLAAAQVDVASAVSPVRMDVSAPSVADAKMVEETAPAALGPSVTIKLPPARRVEAAISPTVAPVELVPVSASAEAPPLQPYARPVPKPAVAEEEGARLERVSLGEIGIVTAPGPMWPT